MFETTWRWVNNDIIRIFGWTIPLIPPPHTHTYSLLPQKENIMVCDFSKEHNSENTAHIDSERRSETAESVAAQEERNGRQQNKREKLRRRIINIPPFMQPALKQRMRKPEKSSQRLGKPLAPAPHMTVPTITPQCLLRGVSVLYCAMPQVKEIKHKEIKWKNEGCQFK